MGEPSPTIAERVLDATVSCVEASGLNGFSLEDVATAAGVARASIYRHFPGGRDEVVKAAATREVAEFWHELVAVVRSIDDLEGRLVLGIMEANRRIAINELLQRLLATEPGDLLIALYDADELVHTMMAGYLRALLDRETLRRGVDPDEAAQYLARILVSYVSAGGSWDLADESRVRRLVRSQFLAGIIEA